MCASKLRTILVLLIFGYAGASVGHGLNLSTIEFSEEEGQYQLSFNLSRLDLITSLLTAYPDMNRDEMEDYIRKYFNGNLGLLVNHVCQDISVENIVFDKDYIRVSASVPFQGDIQSIVFRNSTLVDYNEDHQNIFRAKLNGKLRTFRMTAERTEVLLNYSL